MSTVKPKLLDTKINFSNKYMVLKSDDLLFERKINGKTEILRKEYYSIDCPDFVTCIVIKNDSLLVVKQYRHPVQDMNTEFVAGMIDKGDTPDQSVAKELEEEAGIVPRNLILLGECRPLSGQNRNLCYVYLVNEFTETETKLEPYEEFTGLTRSWIPITEFKKMIRSGELNDGVTLMAWC
jgi:8-oxo-dGTP pyrophosphatase MutT (NUDIX family)